jgi:hypothetical protein
MNFIADVALGIHAGNPQADRLKHIHTLAIFFWKRFVEHRGVRPESKRGDLP